MTGERLPTLLLVDNNPEYRRSLKDVLVLEGYRIEEVEIHHYARTEGGSRGLPPKRIPAEVALLVQGLRRLRAELKQRPPERGQNGRLS